MQQEEDRFRTIAGYLLKNNSRLILQASPNVQVFVKAAVLETFVSSSVMVRNAAGQNIVAFLGVLEPKNWPECLEQLLGLLDSTDLDMQEVSFICSRLYLRQIFVASECCLILQSYSNSLLINVLLGGLQRP